MAKLNLPDIGTLGNSSSARQAINDNFADVEAALDNTLSRDGTGPNAMEAELDMNSHKVLNVADPENDNDAVNLATMQAAIAGAILGEVDVTIEVENNVDVGAAESVLIVDSAAHYTAGNVEEALAEVAVRIDALEEDITELAPLDPTFLTLGAESGLPNERRLTVASPLTYTDGGAGNTLELGVVTSLKTVVDEGAVGNGIADDTAAIEAAFASSIYRIPEGNFKVTSPIVLEGEDIEIWGAGEGATRIFASGDFDALFVTAPDSARIKLYNMTLDTGTTSTKALSFAEGINHSANNIVFTGESSSGTAPLVFVSSSYNKFNNCKFHPQHANLWAAWIDNRSDGGLVIGTVFDGCNWGYSGKGVWIKKSNASQPRCEGTKFSDCDVLNTGSVQLKVDSHYGLQSVGTAWEECGSTAIDLDDNDRAHFIGGSIGLASGVTTVPCMVLRATMGKGTIIGGVTFRTGSYAIKAEASTSASVYDLTIVNNIFDSHTNSSLYLDSVNGCVIVGNVETGSGFADGPISTAGTRFAGSYNLTGNKWVGSDRNVWHTTSIYAGGDDVNGPGIWRRGRHVVGSAGTTTTVSHGLASTPAFVQVTPLDFPVGEFYVSNINSTQFTITWTANTVSVWDWEAKV